MTDQERASKAIQSNPIRVYTGESRLWPMPKPRIESYMLIHDGSAADTSALDKRLNDGWHIEHMTGATIANKHGYNTPVAFILLQRTISAEEIDARWTEEEAQEQMRLRQETEDTDAAEYAMRMEDELMECPF